jgi:hypothetical protein
VRRKEGGREKKIKEEGKGKKKRKKRKSKSKNFPNLEIFERK